MFEIKQVEILMEEYKNSEMGKASKWIQGLVDKEILKYEFDSDSGELLVARGKNYYDAPKNFRMMFEGMS